MDRTQRGIVILVIAMMFVLSGCSMFGPNVVPVTMDFPQAPEPILMQPEQLDTLPEDKKQLSDMLENSTVNYGKHRELQLKYKQWQRWYDTNRKLHKETTSGN